jgi:beta-lactamase superfamily II metal-dependent hydrolase
MVTATLRMYKVGFGDCFLLSVPRVGDRPWRMLVDCGVHFQGLGENSMSAIVDDLIAECDQDGAGPQIDVVVASHRHQDHISGFANPRWSEVTVGEVWLPWCENPRDPVAQRLRTRLDATALALQQRFQADSPEMAALALNSLSNERAMSTLRDGFAGQARRRYLSAAEPTRRELAGLPGARIHLLGPSRSPEAIKAMDPPELERWLALDKAGGGETGSAEVPFGPAYEIADRADYRQQYPHLSVTDDLLDSFAIDPEDGLAAASWLDRALNNTSLVFVLEIEDVRLLFAGDAQWGVWREILNNRDARALLARTTLYKVSHHGSHNGSPKTLVNETLPSSLISMMSFRKMSRWKAIPKTELVDALSAQGRTLLSPEQDPANVPAVSRAGDGLWTEIELG